MDGIPEARVNWVISGGEVLYCNLLAITKPMACAHLSDGIRCGRSRPDDDDLAVAIDADV